MVGLLTMCGDDKPSPQAKVAEDASVQVAVPEEPVAIDAGVTIVAPDPNEIRVECQEYLANQHWTELAACAERLGPFDPAMAKKFDIAARAELLAEKELRAIEDAITRKDKERAKKLLAALPKDSVYRRDAEEVVTTGKTKTTCDGEALKDKGLELTKEGQHAAALATFEAANRCKADPYYAQLAFMAACNAKNAAKAQSYFALLSQAQQTKFEQICIRNKVPLDTKAHCDPETLKDKGMENVNMGQHASALKQFELSLKCKDDSYVRSLAFMAACNSQDVEKARQHYERLTADQRTKYSVMCERNHIPKSKLEAKTTTVAPPADCDANSLKDKGMENVNMGQHAAALAHFEASLRCKNDSYVISLAFMSACNSQNEAKARHYWPKLTGAQQTKFKVICSRNKISLQ
jgi:tetratricopeptide (TPR) repeat protein